MAEMLDDAAAAALWNLRGASTESIGLLYEEQGKLAYTPAQTTGTRSNAKGAFRIPTGSLRGIYHNHPQIDSGFRSRNKAAGGGEGLSPDDVQQAKRAGVPSFITTPDGRLLRYNPGDKIKTGTPVLAQLPMEEIRAQLMSRLFPDRAPDDPRGLKR